MLVYTLAQLKANLSLSQTDFKQTSGILHLPLTCLPNSNNSSRKARRASLKMMTKPGQTGNLTVSRPRSHQKVKRGESTFYFSTRNMMMPQKIQ